VPAYLYDAVTLQHFAVAEALPLLAEVHGDAPAPRWTLQVYREVEAGLHLLPSHGQCGAVLDFTWLGEPAEGDVLETLRMRPLLGGGDDPHAHLGEAESIVVAHASGAVFVTDDGPAYDFAMRATNLGRAGVLDACGILWQAASAQLIDEGGMLDFHHQVFDAGRTMRCRCRMWPGGDSLDDKLRNLRRGR